MNLKKGSTERAQHVPLLPKKYLAWCISSRLVQASRTMMTGYGKPHCRSYVDRPTKGDSDIEKNETLGNPCQLLCGRWIIWGTGKAGIFDWPTRWGRECIRYLQKSSRMTCQFFHISHTPERDSGKWRSRVSNTVMSGQSIHTSQHRAGLVFTLCLRQRRIPVVWLEPHAADQSDCFFFFVNLSTSD